MLQEQWMIEQVSATNTCQDATQFSMIYNSANEYLKIFTYQVFLKKKLTWYLFWESFADKSQSKYNETLWLKQNKFKLHQMIKVCFLEAVSINE